MALMLAAVVASLLSNARHVLGAPWTRYPAFVAAVACVPVVVFSLYLKPRKSLVRALLSTIVFGVVLNLAFVGALARLTASFGDARILVMTFATTIFMCVACLTASNDPDRAAPPAPGIRPALVLAVLPFVAGFSFHLVESVWVFQPEFDLFVLLAGLLWTACLIRAFTLPGRATAVRGRSPIVAHLLQGMCVGLVTAIGFLKVFQFVA